MTRLLCTGDLHLGQGASLGRTPGDRLRDQSAVLVRIFELAAERQVDAILVAGDIFDGPVVTPEQLDVFARFVAAARDAEIPVVAIPGNGKHDLAMREVNGLAIFNEIPGMTVYSRPGVHDLGVVQVACLPWVSAARLVAQSDGDVPRDQVNSVAANLIVKAAASIADTRVKPTVLLMHGSLSGASLPAGISTDDLREPVVPVEELLDLGFAAIVAGHIHQPQIATADDSSWTKPWRAPLDLPSDFDCPLALYTGSPLPLNFGEAHVAHGVWVLDVDRPVTSVRFEDVESRPLVQFDWDAVTAAEQPMQFFPDGAIVKCRITGTKTDLRHWDLAFVRRNLLEAGAHSVKIEVDTIREERSRADGVTEDLDPLDAFDMWATANALTGEEARVRDAREQMQADLEQVAHA